MMIASVIMTLVTSPSLAWTVAVAMPFLVFVIFYVATKTRPLSEKQQNVWIRSTNMFVKISWAYVSFVPLLVRSFKRSALSRSMRNIPIFPKAL